MESESSIGRMLNRVRAELVEALDRELAPFEITSAQFVILGSLVSGDADSASALCKEISYDPGAMTRMIDRLELKGLIRRLPHADDRRRMNLELTEAPSVRRNRPKPFFAGFHQNRSASTGGISSENDRQCFAITLRNRGVMGSNPAVGAGTGLVTIRSVVRDLPATQVSVAGCGRPFDIHRSGAMSFWRNLIIGEMRAFSRPQVPHWPRVPEFAFGCRAEVLRERVTDGSHLSRCGPFALAAYLKKKCHTASLDSEVEQWPNCCRA